MLENKNHMEDSGAARWSEKEEVLTILFDPEDTDMAMLKAGTIPGIFSYTSQETLSLSPSLYSYLLKVGFHNFYLKEACPRQLPFGIIFHLDTMFNERYVNSRPNAIFPMTGMRVSLTISYLIQIHKGWWMPSTTLIKITVEWEVQRKWCFKY